MSKYRQGKVSRYFQEILVILYPLVDLLRVFILRIKDGQSPFIADQRHIHHKLLILLKKHSLTVISISIINFIICGLYLFVYYLLLITNTIIESVGLILLTNLVTNNMDNFLSSNEIFLSVYSYLNLGHINHIYLITYVLFFGLSSRIILLIFYKYLIAKVRYKIQTKSFFSIISSITPISDPKTATIPPSPFGIELCITLPRIFNIFNVFENDKDPAEAKAEYSPSECPAK